MLEPVLSSLRDWSEFVFGSGDGRVAITPLQMVGRATVIYVSTVLLLRLGQRRSLSDATAFDVVLGIVIGSVAGRAITGASLVGAIAAIAALIGLHWLTSALSLRLPAFSNFVKGGPIKIVHEGKVNRRALRYAHMTPDDLEEDLRDKGVENPRNVKGAWLERSGKLSVVERSPARRK